MSQREVVWILMGAVLIPAAAPVTLGVPGTAMQDLTCGALGKLIDRG